MRSIYLLKKTCCIVNLDLSHCWSARDVTVAILVVVKNKSISVLWKLNLFERKLNCTDPQHGHLVTWFANSEYCLCRETL